MDLPSSCGKTDMPAIYRIHVMGALGTSWSRYLGGAEIKQAGETDSPVTMLTGCAQDQAALLGILNTLYDLGLPLLSCECKYSAE
jgi:hypothetical protein